MSWSKGDLIEDRPNREAPLRARIAELEGKLAEVEPLLRQWFGLCGFTDHAPEALSEATDSALSNPTPSAQALTRLVEAVGRECEVERLADEIGQGSKPGAVTEVLRQARKTRRERRAAYRALLAARSGWGEGE